MFTEIEKFGNRLNGHVLKREYAIEALQADIVNESITLHHSYSPLLLEYQMKADYKSCFSALLATSCGNIILGALISLYKPFGGFRLIGLAVVAVGIYLCAKMISSYPRNQDDNESLKTQVDVLSDDGVSI